MGWTEKLLSKFSGEDFCRTMYFREDGTFEMLNLPIEDGCIILKKDDRVVRAWGHSPRAMLPVEGEDQEVQLVNDRDANPCDPFQLIPEKDRFTTATANKLAIEQNDKALSASSGIAITGVQMVMYFAGGFLFLVGGIVWTLQTSGVID